VSLIEAKDVVSLSISGEHSLIENGYIEHIKRINDVFYDQIKISDQKAAYIFTFMLAFLATSTEGRAVFTLENYAQLSPRYWWSYPVIFRNPPRCFGERGLNSARTSVRLLWPMTRATCLSSTSGTPTSSRCWQKGNTDA
jgi:hypothetical protein